MSSHMPLSPNSSYSPHSSSTPLITSAQLQDLQQAETSTETNSDEKDKALERKHSFDICKKEENQMMDPRVQADKMPQMGTGFPTVSLASCKQQQSDARRSPPAPLSPLRLAYQSTVTSSPSRLRSSSPRLQSPGNSEIFERNVQEPMSISNLHGELSPAHIPAHVITEDSIPPALEASAQAITSASLNPDDVEIVTSSSHQPAASGIDGSAGHADLISPHSPPLLYRNKSDETTSSYLHQSSTLPTLEDDGASSYGQLDPNDVRRLSFISFQDIVQSEQNHHQMTASALGEAGSRDSLHIHDRTGSPIRTPRSPISPYSQSINGLTTPPTSVNIIAATRTSEQSPVRSVKLGSPGSQHGDLNIETMRQALRKTASVDFSGGGGRSAGMSPVSDAASFREVPRTTS